MRRPTRTWDSAYDEADMTSSENLQIFRSNDSLDQWQVLVDEIYGSTTNHSLGDGVFHGELLTRGLGCVMATRIASTPMKYERAQSSSATDSYFIALTLCAEARLDQIGRQSIQRYGDIVLYDGSQPYSCVFPAGDDQTCLLCLGSSC